jgi:histidine triad (HIT) family protein
MRAPGPGTSCIFCGLIRRESPAHVVYEDDRTLAFLDLFPLSRGHTLVVPKRHVDRITELPREDYSAMLGAVVEVCRRIERLSRHYNVGVNQGELAGQIVFHLHFHIIPRYENDSPFSRTRPRSRLSEAEAAEVLRELASGNSA